MRKVIFQPQINIYLPQEVVITNWRIEENKLKVEFQIPYVLKGELEAKIFWEQQKGDLYEGIIKVEYDYQSNHSWKWNYFEFDFEQTEELPQIWEKILNLTPLKEEMEYRKEVPPDLPENFKDSYGESVVEDIKKALTQLQNRQLGILLAQTG